jgi:hypothetical protein
VFTSRVKTTATTFSHPEGQPEHAPPPPRPFGLVTALGSANAFRFTRGCKAPDRISPGTTNQSNCTGSDKFQNGSFCSI